MKQFFLLISLAPEYDIFSLKLVGSLFDFQMPEDRAIKIRKVKPQN